MVILASLKLAAVPVDWITGFTPMPDFLKTTGNPNDDGFLTNPKYQAQINAYEDPQSYRDLRSVSTDNPYNYSLPRRIRLGLELNF